MKKTIIVLLAVLSTAVSSFAQAVGHNGQTVDTTGIYGERADSLDAAVFVSRQAGNARKSVQKSFQRLAFARWPAVIWLRVSRTLPV